MKWLFIILFFFITEANFALAVNSDAFNIRLLGSIDITRPSSPVLLSAVPVSLAQIDLVWASSTDNIGVDGYVIVRDGVIIATTTAFTYSDVGLVADTTYNYVIRAFDLVRNYSLDSNNISPNSTLVSGSGNPGTIADSVLDYFLIKVGVSTTSIYLETAYPTRIEIRWGKTTSYEAGYTIKEAHVKEQSILLADLSPETKYFYEIIGYSPHDHPTVLKNGQFKTLNPDSFKVKSTANVRYFKAVRQGDDVSLTWQSPDIDNFSHVRIVRSHLGFPEYPQDGAVIYQGNKGVVDKSILSQYSPVYYTAFVYDVFGNVSSGAIALVYEASGEDGLGFSSKDKSISQIGIPPPEIASEATSSVVLERVTIDMKMPTAEEIILSQKGVFFDLSKNNITLDSSGSFVVSLPVEAVSGNLKSIIVTVSDPADTRQAYSYLLRINKDKTAYEASVAALLVQGRSQIQISIYDYEAFVVATYQAPINFFTSSSMVGNSIVFPDLFYENVWSSMVVLTGLPTVFFLFVRRRDKITEDNTNEM